MTIGKSDRKRLEKKGEVESCRRGSQSKQEKREKVAALKKKAFLGFEEKKTFSK